MAAASSVSAAGGGHGGDFNASVQRLEACLVQLAHQQQQAQGALGADGPSVCGHSQQLAPAMWGT